MYIVIDETGELEAKEEGGLGLCTLVMINDKSWIKLSKLLRKLDIDPSIQKSSDLSYDNRERITNFIASCRGIHYYGICHDPVYSEIGWIEWHRKEQSSRIDKFIEADDDSLKAIRAKNLTIFRNQYKNLKNPDFIKFTMITEAFMKWFEYFQYDIDRYPPSDDSWEIKIRIDTQNKHETFIRLLTGYVKMTIHPEANNGISIKYNKDIPLHHPFHRRNAGEDGHADPNIFLRDINVVSERDAPQLFIPDFIGNTFYRAYKNHDDKYLRLSRKLGFRRMQAMKFKPNSNHILKVISFDRKKIKLNSSLENFLQLTKL